MSRLQLDRGRVLRLPTISIVVPNFQGASTIRETIKSLIHQEYEGLQIIVVDGGSSDGSVDLIREFSHRIDWWISEKDSGQSNAINKGFARCTGDVVSWLCSDDQLEAGALHAIGRYFIDDTVDVIVGKCRFVYHDPPEVKVLGPDLRAFSVMPCMNAIPQPSCFYRRRLLDREKPLDESLHYVMDFELWNYFKSRGARWIFVDDVLSVFHQSGTNKSSTGGERITREMEAVYRLYCHERIPLTFWHRRLRYPLEKIRRRHRGILFAAIIYFPWQCMIIALLSPFYGFSRLRTMNWVEWG